MIPPHLDFSSDLFDPYKALHSNKVHLPYPKAFTYNNIAEYNSRHFLKKGYDSNKFSKNKEKTRERNYDWYYDTLGLSDRQRNYIQRTKKIKRRKGKKPVSVVTIPGSPLKSKKVTIIKSDFKDYCRRKYRSLDFASPIMDTKSKEFEAFPPNNTSEPFVMSSMLKTEPDSTSVLPLIKCKTEGFSPASYSAVTEHPTSLFHIKKSEPHESPTVSRVIKTELPSSCVVKTEPLDSSDDSFPDDELICKMKTNVQKGYALKTVYESPDSYQIKQEPLWAKNKNVHFSSKYVRQTTCDKKLSEISKPCYLSSSVDHSSNACSNMKSSSAHNDSGYTSQVENPSALVHNQKKKLKKCNDDELKLPGDYLTPKHKKKQKPDKNKDDNSTLSVCDQSKKSATQNTFCQKKSPASKENSSVDDSKSNMKLSKKCKKSALKSQENMLDQKKLSTAKDSKPKRISKIKAENSPVDNHCTCKFPCGLSHLCTCGYYANAKEALSKFKIPRKKK